LPTQGYPFNVLWSPNEKRMAYLDQLKTGFWYLVVTGLDDFKPHRFLLGDWNTIVYFIWYPDSRHILLVFLDDELKRTGKFKCMDIETERLFDVMKGLVPYAGSWTLGGMSWSPDGRFLVYVGYQKSYRELFAVKVDKYFNVSDKPIQITRFEGNTEPCWPSFTRDGKGLCYGVFENLDDIYCMSFDPRAPAIFGNPLAIAIDRARDYDPFWLPDENGVLFVSWRDGQPYLYVFDIAKGKTIRKTYTKQKEQYPQVSPDGRLFSYWADDAIWGLDKQSGTYRRLTPVRFSIKGLYAWSADINGLFAVIKDTSDRKEVLCRFNLVDSSASVVCREMYFTDIVRSPNGKRLALRFLSNTNQNEVGFFVGWLNVNSDSLKNLTKISSISPLGRLCWTGDGQNILFDLRDPDFKYKLLSTVTGKTKSVQFEKGQLNGDIFIQQISPSGNRVLIKTVMEESDLWVRGIDFDTLQ
jgi:hypothetical protein